MIALSTDIKLELLDVAARYGACLMQGGCSDNEIIYIELSYQDHCLMPLLLIELAETIKDAGATLLSYPPGLVGITFNERGGNHEDSD